MYELTNQELGQLLYDAARYRRAVNVSLSQHGIHLSIGQVSRKITEDQAEMLWEILPKLAAGHTEKQD